MIRSKGFVNNWPVIGLIWIHSIKHVLDNILNLPPLGIPVNLSLCLYHLVCIEENKPFSVTTKYWQFTFALF